MMKPMRCALVLMFAPLSAWAWDPNEGADLPPPASYQPSVPYQAPTPLYQPGRAVAAPSPAQPIRYAPTPTPATYAAPVAAPRPYVAPVSAQPLVPVYVPAAPAYVPPPPAYVAPATPYPSYPTQDVVPVSPTYSYQEASRDRSSDAGSIGIEGFWDHYEEDSVDLKTDSIYGSITAGYTHYFDSGLFTALDGRVSRGDTDYESISGTLDGIPEWEFELRTLVGTRMNTNSGGDLEFYSGLGNRYFSQEGKGETTNLGARAYDRRIYQLYLPLGLTHRSTLENGWSMRLNGEADALLFGNVSSRLQNTGLAYGNIVNRQEAFSGWGLRGEAMFGSLDDQGTGFEAGPFLRYWFFEDSKDDFDPVSGGTFIEPENSRWQFGVNARYNF